jgi:Na+-transporting methylmalonyl-CoA/oxaloacetate decarboxylase beta subunit
MKLMLSIRNVVNLSAFPLLIFAIIGAVTGYQVSSQAGSETQLVCAAVGLGLGIGVGTLIASWFRMQARVAEQIMLHLDGR